MNDNDSVLLTVDEAARMLRLGRTFVYGLVLRGDIDSLKLGRSRRIPRWAVESFVRERVEQERVPA